MDLNGKQCGFCLKGVFHALQDEVEPGIFVSAFKCNKCSEVAYTEEIMAKVEAMRRGDAEARSLIKIGASLAFSIPAAIVKKLGLKAKRKVYVSAKGNEIIARVSLSA